MFNVCHWLGAQGSNEGPREYSGWKDEKLSDLDFVDDAEDSFHKPHHVNYNFFLKTFS